jgi:pantetheine-phosphate adenylyltransferase
MQVIFPGTFDPPTNGHLDLMRRAARMFGRVVVVIAVNPDKVSLFTAQERLKMINSLVQDLPNAEAHVWQGLIVEFARREGIYTLLRGVRALSDFEYEFELSMMNKALFPRIETIFLPTDQKYFVLRSSGIKEVARFGGDVRSMVPKVVAQALTAKLGPLAAAPRH